MRAEGGLHFVNDVEVSKGQIRGSHATQNIAALSQASLKSRPPFTQPRKFA